MALHQSDNLLKGHQGKEIIYDENYKIDLKNN